MKSSKGFAPHWPKGVDGTERFPENHALLRESPKTRIVDVHIAAGTAERPHTHMLKSFMFTDRPAKIAVRWVDKSGVEKLVFRRSRSQGTPRRPIAHPMPAEPFHYVENIDIKDYRAIRVEFKGGASSAPRDILLRPKEQFRLAAQDLDLLLIGSLRTDAIVKYSINGLWESLDRLGILEAADRPPVWVLPAKQAYVIENRSSRTDWIYRLEA